MNKTPLFFTALALLALGSCAKESGKDIPQDEPLQEEMPVGFGAYMNRSVTTKAGWAGDLATDKLKADANGFGVFGYYTKDEPYSASAKPDFMYNEHVYWTESVQQWEYGIIKYWPNAYGENAESNVIDRLSFFAYAPYVEVDNASGLVLDDGTANYDSAGITALSRNTASGDPQVKYTASMDPHNCVDLCWGVSARAFTSSVDGTNNDVKAGQPFLNLVKPKINDRLQFEFRHALAALNVLIDTDVDVVSHKDGDLNGATRIYVRSVTFEGFTDKGALNLNSRADASVAPLWTSLTGGKPDNTPVTVYDARRDGKEGVAGADASNETPTGLNPSVIQSAPYYNEDGTPNTTTITPGVTHASQNLFYGEEMSTSVLVIPNGQAMKVTVVYDVETIDPKLAKTLSDGKTKGSTIENAITKAITINDDDLILEAGKKYTLNLHLGMTSVKVSASVSGWDDGSEANTDVPGNVPSPSNPGAYSDGSELPDVQEP